MSPGADGPCAGARRTGTGHCRVLAAADMPVGAVTGAGCGRQHGGRERAAAERTHISAPPLRRVASKTGVRRRLALHQLRHAHAVELAHEGVPLNVIQRQLGHTNLGVTSIYLQGIDNAEILATVHARRAPMIPASTRLRI
jgi:Phage integrase family